MGRTSVFKFGFVFRGLFIINHLQKASIVLPIFFYLLKFATMITKKNYLILQNFVLAGIIWRYHPKS